MTHDGRAVANFILDTAEADGVYLSNLSLQKIMFFCHAWHLVDEGEPLIKHEFEAWEHGPVLQFVYRQFKEFGSGPIKGRAKAMDPLTGKMAVVPTLLNESTRARLRDVVRFYAKLSPWDLVDMSHVKGGPWDLVWNGSGRINPGMKIDHESVRIYYSKAIVGRPIQ